MKTTILTILLMFAILFSNAQIKKSDFTISLGTTRFTVEDTYLCPKQGIVAALSYKNIYVEYANNLKQGDGKKISLYDYKYNPRPTVYFKDYEAQSQLLNIGYIIKLTDQFYFTPMIGVKMKNYIFQNWNGSDSYFKGEYSYKANIGFTFTIPIKNIGITAGLSRFELYKLMLTYRFK